MSIDNNSFVSFTLGGMHFEYDEQKNAVNIKKHGVSLRSAARVFFDYNRIEFFDEENSIVEDRYDAKGWLQILKGGFIMGNTNNILECSGQEFDFTKTELEQLRRARNMPIVFDKDCPETTPERAKKFKRVNPPRKQVIS